MTRLASLLRRRAAWRQWTAAGVGGLLALALAGLLVPRPVTGQEDAGPATTVAAVIQGGVPSTGVSTCRTMSTGTFVPSGASAQWRVAT